MPPLLSAQETAAYLGVSTETVIARAKSGSLKASFVNNRWRFFQTDIIEFVSSQRRSN